mgnify:CR=1 FL=1
MKNWIKLPKKEYTELLNTARKEKWSDKKLREKIIKLRNHTK